DERVGDAGCGARRLAWAVTGAMASPVSRSGISWSKLATFGPTALPTGRFPSQSPTLVPGTVTFGNTPFSSGSNHSRTSSHHRSGTPHPACRSRHHAPTFDLAKPKMGPD